jgi:type II secretory pathway pseudopilin PulG
MKTRGGIKWGTGGFTLIEAMLGIAILSFALLGVVALMSYFGSQTSEKTLRGCLLDAASNGLMQYRANALPVATSFSCEGYTGTVSVTPSTFPGPNTCNNVTSTATAKGKSLEMTTMVCDVK